MARALSRPPPSSSVARLLDVSAATRAVAARPDSPNEPKPLTTERTFIRASVPRDVPRSIKRELSLCDETDSVLEEIVRAVRAETGTRVTPSQVVRAMLRALGHVSGLIE